MRRIHVSPIGLASLLVAVSFGCSSHEGNTFGHAAKGAASGAQVLTCQKLRVNRGSIGDGQGAAALATRELSGTEDVWRDYVEFEPRTSATCTFALSDSTAADIASLALQVNYRGPKKAEMRWKFHVWDAKAKAWVYVGDNGFAKNWVWTAATLDLPDLPERFFSNGKLRIRYSTGSRADASNIDQLVVLAPPKTGDDNGSTGGTGGASGDTGGTGGAHDGGTGGTGGTSGDTGGTGGASGGTGGTSGGTGGTGGTSDDTGGTGGTHDGGTGGTSGGTGGTSEIWQPRPGTSWQWQLTGSIDTSFDVEMYDIDLFDTPQSTIDELKRAGRKVVCYFSAGTREDWRSDANQFPAGSYGRSLSDWDGENWVDIRNSAVRDIMLARLDLAVSKRCDAVEPDNVDGYTNNSGFPLTSADQLGYNRFLATSAHARNLSIGLKNDVGQVAELVDYFDWALNEECFQYDECETLMPFIEANKAVFHVEYGSPSLASSVCPVVNSMNFDTLIKNLDLDATRTACR